MSNVQIYLCLCYVVIVVRGVVFFVLTIFPKIYDSHIMTISKFAGNINNCLVKKC